MLHVYCDTMHLLNFGRTLIVQCDNDVDRFLHDMAHMQHTERQKKRPQLKI